MAEKDEGGAADEDDVVAALLALARGDAEAARARARSAAGGGARGLLGPALARFLAGGRPDVWTGGAVSAEAFSRFIDGGGNVGLYDAAFRRLQAVHRLAAPESVLDLGCGDGRLSAAAVHPGLRRLDLVDPSGDRLAEAVGRLEVEAPGVEVRAHEATAEAFLAGSPQRWDVAQSTFALLTLPPEARRSVLAALAGRVGRLLVVEFDVPAFADRSVEHARYAAERYEVGVAEYAGDDLVVDGFLVPVLVAQFERGARRATWEQPVAASAAELAASGFATVEDVFVADYWWAPAHLLDARDA